MHRMSKISDYFSEIPYENSKWKSLII